MQQLFANDPALLRIKIRQLELLSLLRGESIQKIIIQEEQKMPVHIDITKDLRYQQGVAEKNFDISFVPDITELSEDILESIALELEKQ